MAGKNNQVGRLADMRSAFLLGVYMPMRPPVHKPFRSQPKKDERPSAYRRGYDNGQWQAIRKRVLSRDHYICQSCGEPTGGSGEVDHIVARRNGGSDDLDNLQTLCKACHSRKTAKGL